MLRRTGLSSRRAVENASSPHGNQSTGLCACCSRYGLVSRASRLARGDSVVESVGGVMVAARRKLRSGSAGDIPTDQSEVAPAFLRRVLRVSVPARIRSPESKHALR